MTKLPRDSQDERRGTGGDRHGRPEADGLDNRWSLSGPGTGNGGGGRGPDPEQWAMLHNNAIIRSTAVLMALCLLFALPQPQALMAASFAGYLFAVATAAALWALFTRQAPMAPHLTRWDQAAFLLAVSLFAGFFVDPEAARQAIENLRQTENGGG